MPAYDGDDLPTPPSPYGEFVPPPAGYPYPPPAGYLAQTNSRLPEENTPHYGAIGRVPWTLQQTLAGTAITLVPWMAVLLLSAASSSGTHGLTKPLPRSADLIGGIIFFLFSAVVECAFVLAPLYFAVWRRAPAASVQQGWRALGFRRTPVGQAVAWIVGGLAVSLAATIAYGALVQLLRLNLQTNGDALAQEARYAPLTVVGALLAAVFIAPICEELFFRGYLFAGLLRGIEVVPAVALSALLFAIAHGDVGSFVPLLIFGVVLAVARFKTGSIWPGMAMHILNNALTTIVVVASILH
jgi:membrane protease YdiL (CAAX protease family)